MNEVDLAYIAGFFDGEGSVSVFMVKASKDGVRRPRLDAKIAQNDRAVLDWIKDQFGCGNVYPKYDKRNPNLHHGMMFTYKSARIFLTAIEPYLRVKKSKVTEVLDRFGREKLPSSIG